MPETDAITLAIVEAPTETKVTLNDKKEAAFLMPAKEDVAGFTAHAFAKSRKGFVIATGNELLNTERHLESYKEAHPDWETKLDVRESMKELTKKLDAALTIEDPDKRAETEIAAKQEYQNNLDWLVMSEAIPDFMFQLSALAYICVTSAAVLSRLVGKSREYFNEQVATWADDLTDDQWEKLTVRAFQELVESNIGNDFKVKEEKGGAPASPN
jgi:hypothetical protein